MEQVIDMLAIVGIIVTVILMERAVYWWRNQHDKE